MTRTAIVVQARMKSTRLPGKVLEDLGGQTVLAHVLQRCRAVPGVDVVVCAVPEGADDQPVADAAAHSGAVVVRGSESDVLARYWLSAQAVAADIVMRVTSDCPLIDPALCGAIIALRQERAADYACNNMSPSWPHGLDAEVFTRAALDLAYDQAVRPSEREHVTPFMRNHPDFTLANLPCPLADTQHHRWTLDTPEDLAFLRALWPLLPAGPAGWDWRVPLALVQADPELAAINAGQHRYAGLQASLQQDENLGFGTPPAIT